MIDSDSEDGGHSGPHHSAGWRSRRRVTVLVLKVKINTPRPKREGSLGLNKPVRTARGPARDSEDMLVHLASRYI